MKKISVKEATKLSFFKMGNEFHMLALVRSTRKMTNRPHLPDGTITRRLRELRWDNIIDYEVIGHKYSKKREWIKDENRR